MAASTMVLSDLVNVVRFMIDKASQAATDSEVKKMQETAEKGSEHMSYHELRSIAEAEEVDFFPDDSLYGLAVRIAERRAAKHGHRCGKGDEAHPQAV